MWYREAKVDPAHAPFVLCAWELGVPSIGAQWREHLVFPDGCCALVYWRRRPSGQHSPEGHVRVAGPRLAPLRVRLAPGDRYWGLRLQPAACHAALGLAPGALRDRVVDYGRIAPGRATQVRAALDFCRTFSQGIAALTACLSSWLPRPDKLDGEAAAVAAAIVAQSGVLRIGALDFGAGCGQRQLERRFRRAVGLTMKEFARARRIRAVAEALSLGRRSRWADMAAAHGFADQAHFSRELLAAAGHAPREFERRILQFSAELAERSVPPG